MDPEAQSVFCASPSSSPSYTWRTPNREGNITKTSTAHETSPTIQKNPTNELRTSFASAARTEWTCVWQYSPRSRASGRTVTVAMTVLCYYQRERGRETGAAASARTGAAERASERGLEPVRVMGVVGRGTGLFTTRCWCSGRFWMG